MEQRGRRLYEVSHGIENAGNSKSNCLLDPTRVSSKPRARQLGNDRYTRLRACKHRSRAFTVPSRSRAGFSNPCTSRKDLAMRTQQKIEGPPVVPPRMFIEPSAEGTVVAVPHVTSENHFSKSERFSGRALFYTLSKSRRVKL